MQTQTRIRFNEYRARIAELNGVPAEFVSEGSQFDVAPEVQSKAFDRMRSGLTNGLIDAAARKEFAAGATPTPMQTLVQRRMDTIAFLSQVNIIGVRDLIGMPVGMNMAGMIAGRTLTTGGAQRVGKNPMALDNFPYLLSQTNFDITVLYSLLDQWSKFPNFEAMLRDEILILQGLNRIAIGWNGSSIAATTDPTANPLGQDVNKGWLQILADSVPAQILSAVSGGALSGHVTYGAAGDYKNLDALVWDAKETLLPVWYREDPELVVIVGTELIHDKYFGIIDTTEGSLDQLARQTLMAQTRSFGGLPAVRVPFFPPTSVVITKLRNLSIYYQEGRNRRLIQDAPWSNGINDWQSSNEGYVLEDPYGMCAVKNIQRKDS